MKKSVFAAGLATVFFLAAGAGLYASERFMSVSDLARQADVAVRAKILKAESKYIQTEHGRFAFIIYTAKNNKTIFGECPSEFTFRVPGLVTKNRIVTSAEAPALAPGEEAVLFLNKVEGSETYTLAAMSAVLPVIPVMAPADEKGGDDEDVVVLPPQKGPDGKAVRVRIKLSDLTAQVKAARANRGKKGAEK